MKNADQKKSKSGKKTPPAEIAKVKTRLNEAEKHHAEWTAKQRRQKQNGP